MQDVNAVGDISKQRILNDILEIIDQFSLECELEPEQSIGTETYLGSDLCFTSIEIVRLISEIQQKYGNQLIPFQELFIRGDEIVQDLRIRDLVDFLLLHLNQ